MLEGAIRLTAALPCQTPQPTPPNSTFATLEPVLAAEGATLLVSVLQNLAEAQANATEQDPALVSLAPKLHKDMAHVDWAAQTADELLRLQAGIAHQVRTVGFVYLSVLCPQLMAEVHAPAVPATVLSTRARPRASTRGSAARARPAPGGVIRHPRRGGALSDPPRDADVRQTV